MPKQLSLKEVFESSSQNSVKSKQIKSLKSYQRNLTKLKKFNKKVQENATVSALLLMLDKQLNQLLPNNKQTQASSNSMHDEKVAKLLQLLEDEQRNKKISNALRNSKHAKNPLNSLIPSPLMIIVTILSPLIACVALVSPHVTSFTHQILSQLHVPSQHMNSASVALVAVVLVLAMLLTCVVSKLAGTLTTNNTLGKRLLQEINPNDTVVKGERIVQGEPIVQGELVANR